MHAGLLITCAGNKWGLHPRTASATRSEKQEEARSEKLTVKEPSPQRAAFYEENEPDCYQPPYY